MTDERLAEIEAALNNGAPEAYWNTAHELLAEVRRLRVADGRNDIYVDGQPLDANAANPPLSDCHRLIHRSGDDAVYVSSDGVRVAMVSTFGVHSMSIAEWALTFLRNSLYAGVINEAIAECEKWRDHHAKGGKEDRAVYWAELAWRWRRGVTIHFENMTGVSDPTKDDLVRRIAELEAKLAASGPTTKAEPTDADLIALAVREGRLVSAMLSGSGTSKLRYRVSASEKPSHLTDEYWLPEDHSLTPEAREILLARWREVNR